MAWKTRMHGLNEQAQRSSEGNLLLAAERAVEAGARVMRQSRSHIGALIANGDRDFATDVDRRVEAAIRDSLERAAPGVAFVGEEGGGDEMSDRPCWVLDPIDGTINFARNSPLCAISLSLVMGGQPLLGVVDAPFLGERFTARNGAGASCNGARIDVFDPAELDEAIIGVSDLKVGVGSAEENRIQLSVLARLARESLRVRMHGSAALDLAWLAAGRLHATVMLSNLPWDVTAGLLLVREAGGSVFDFDGTRHDADSRYTLASAPSLVAAIWRIVRESM